MTYVVTEACIRCKYTDCVDVCPVECFYEGITMLVIHPDECIDCGVCEPECPANAIVPDSAADPRWVSLNAEFAVIWPNIVKSIDPLPNADDQLEVQGKYEAYFDPAPGDQAPGDQR